MPQPTEAQQFSGRRSCPNQVFLIGGEGVRPDTSALLPAVPTFALLSLPRLTGTPPKVRHHDRGGVREGAAAEPGPVSGGR